jgi:putative ABC transport system permease protein
MTERDTPGPEPVKVGPTGKDGAALVKVVPHGWQLVAPLSVATPEVLGYQGIAPSQVDPTAEVLTRPGDLSGLALSGGGDQLIDHPKVQQLPLSIYPGEQNRLITMHAVQRLGLQLVPSGWLIRTSRPLTAAQIGVAQNLAAPGGLFVETRKSNESRAQLGRDATLIGLGFALAVLAMTVGLIRSETAGDLRTLAATGASSVTRRTLTAATAGALALLGAILGTAGAYVALVAWHRSDEWTLGHVPYANLTIVVVGLPVLAFVGGWLLAGREPSAVARQPMQ